MLNIYVKLEVLAFVFFLECENLLFVVGSFQEYCSQKQVLKPSIFKRIHARECQTVWQVIVPVSVILSSSHLEWHHSALGADVSNLSVSLSSGAFLRTFPVIQKQHYQYNVASISTQDLETCNSNTSLFFSGQLFFGFFVSQR